MRAKDTKELTNESIKNFFRVSVPSSESIMTIARWFKKGAGFVTGTARRVLRTTTPAPFLNHVGYWIVTVMVGIGICEFNEINLSVAQDGFRQPRDGRREPNGDVANPREGASPSSTTLKKKSRQRLVLSLPKEYLAKDKDGDGQIGLHEWDRAKYAEFKSLDKNGDGFLTAAELTPSKPASTNRVRLTGNQEEAPLHNPGNLFMHTSKIGQSFKFTVTGRTSGPVWGTGVYTTDSDLATAAVHAGVVKNGETRTVKVTIKESPEAFTGSMANEVTSHDWPKFNASFSVE
ncbi:MAG: hypothetical protein FJ267_06495 [Planctomycetes bacterium]|nr:hypothetical protein [Planctomycetota bacterium]